MYSIWGFILQTVEISLIAIFILIIKNVFKDKLSPKWQYASWTILFIHMIIPVGIFKKYLSTSIAIYLEIFKSIIEKTMNSNYIEVYDTIKIRTILPIINKLPNSITDYLFIIYILGIIIFIMKYLIQYIKINYLINQRIENNEITKKICDISNEYNLKPCKTIIVDEIPTAFVFGILNPILVLPSSNTDEKIILHELIHVKNHDGLQSATWSIIFAFHWCNPFMNFVLKQIKNDMESLCDQEVLERLSGEERRDYGRILLEMCSDSYASAFGTTSISNGTKHIKSRIESIVRFKKYPKGIGLVSICMLILLIPLGVSGQEQVTLDDNFIYDSSFEHEYALARGRLVECSTVAGAIDTFVKGLNQTNEGYIMSVTSNNHRNNFEEYYKNLPFKSKLDIENHNIAIYFNDIIDYYVLNLSKINDEYIGIVALLRDGTFKDSRPADIFEYIPIKVIDEDGYKVEINGDITYQTFNRNHGTILLDIEEHYPFKHLNIECETGNLDIKLFKTAKVTQKKYQVYSSSYLDLFGENSSLFEDPDPHAKFQSIKFDGIIQYNSNLEDVYHIGMATVPESINFEEVKIYSNSEVSGGSNRGLDYTFKRVDKNWDIKLNHFISNYNEEVNFNYESIKLRIYKNYKVIEELLIRW